MYINACSVVAMRGRASGYTRPGRINTLYLAISKHVFMQKVKPKYA